MAILEQNGPVISTLNRIDINLQIIIEKIIHNSRKSQKTRETRNFAQN